MNWNSTQQRLSVLCQAAAFQGLSWEALVTLAERFEPMVYESGTTLSEPVFVLVEGRIGSFPPGQLVWEVPAPAAEERCLVLQLSRTDFAEMVEMFPEIGLWLLRGQS